MTESAGREARAFVLPRVYEIYKNLRKARTHRMADVLYLRYLIYVEHNSRKVLRSYTTTATNASTRTYRFPPFVPSPWVE